MKPLSFPPPSLLFIAVLTASQELFFTALRELEDGLGRRLKLLHPWKFENTSYYSPEMGDDLYKGFIAFPPPFSLRKLPDIKRLCRGIEWRYGTGYDSGIRRSINLDPGVVTLANVMLATSKNFSHRIYLRDGVFAEVTLIYHKTRWEQLPWTYPDYKLDKVQRFLGDLRNTLHAHIKSRSP